MKPPLTYYGGKQMLSKLIVSLIPKHNLYCEPFFGGGAVFFAKEPSKLEVINDTNGELINFYKVLKRNFNKLEKEIKCTLHSREYHQDAKTILNYPHLFNDVKRAWAVWTLANQSYGSKLNGVWGYDYKQNTSAKRLNNKKLSFVNIYTERLEFTQIECRDALNVIESFDSQDSFFYCDPSYFNSNMGHYKGYKVTDFENLLISLSKIKGKFLLSSYNSELLEKYAKNCNWYTQMIELPVTIRIKKTKYPKIKTEVLTANF